MNIAQFTVVGENGNVHRQLCVLVWISAQNSNKKICEQLTRYKEPKSTSKAPCIDLTRGTFKDKMDTRWSWTLDSTEGRAAGPRYLQPQGNARRIILRRPVQPGGMGRRLQQGQVRPLSPSLQQDVLLSAAGGRRPPAPGAAPTGCLNL